jgi:hypothetical protein
MHEPHVAREGDGCLAGEPAGCLTGACTTRRLRGRARASTIGRRTVDSELEDAGPTLAPGRCSKPNGKVQGQTRAPD